MTNRAANRSIIVKSVAVVVAMFGFGYALVPLYDLFCDITGINGRTGVVDAESVKDQRVDETRLVTVQFIGNASGGLPWALKPQAFEMRLHPGQAATTSYLASNLSGEDMVGRAIMSVSPSRAAVYFKKVECFCFSNQPLSAGETKSMPVQFVIESDLPSDIRTITLSYAFFDAAKYAGNTESPATGEQI